MSSAKRILIYRIGQIGDTVIALPAFWAVREQFPGAHLALLSNHNPEAAHPTARAVLPETGLIDEWLTYPGSSAGTPLRGMAAMALQIRRRRFDTLIYLAPRIRDAGRIRRDLFFFRLAGIRSVIGHTGLGQIPPRLPDQPLPGLDHEADHLLHRIRMSGIHTPPPGQGRMDLGLTERELSEADSWLQSQPAAPGSVLVGIGPGSKWQSKRWPEGSFTELGQRLIDAPGVHPIVFGGPEDREMAARLVGTWKKGSIAAGVLGVRQAAAALRRCALYVGNDTGAMHLAAAVGTPCVAIFSAQDWPDRWNPYGPGHLVLRRQVPCEGCRLSRCETQGTRCLTEIQVTEVLDACLGLLKRVGR